MADQDLALQATEIRKTFGHNAALVDFSLHVRRGEFVTLFGRNGAGKTTFLKIAATLMRATKGELRVNGFSVAEQPEKARATIGFLSHTTSVYRDLSAAENLRFFARLYDVRDAETRIPQILERVGLKRRSNDAVRSFSRGLHQRVGIARVLLHNPSLLLLDEPYTGLDAQASAILDQLLDERMKAGGTVLLTTHDLEQGLRAANRAVILDRGKLVFAGDARGSDVRSAYNEFVRIGVSR